MHIQMQKNKKFKDLSVQDKSKVISESWQKLKDAQKQQYVDLANDDKKRYNKEMKQLEKKGYFINQEGKRSTDLQKNGKPKAPVVVAKDKVKAKAIVEKKKVAEKKKAEEKPDVTMPKKPNSSYMCFSIKSWPEMKAQHPNLAITELTKKVAERWGKMSEKDKQPYVKLHQESQARYEKEMKQFKELGYFINSDGIKSTFLTRKGKAKEFEEGTVMPKAVKNAYMFFNAE